MKAYKLKLTVKNSHPPVWRRLVVPSKLTFSQLNVVLNKVLGVDNKKTGEFEFFHISIRIKENPTSNIESGYAYYDSMMTLIEAYFDSQNWFTYGYDNYKFRVDIEEILENYNYDYPKILDGNLGEKNINDKFFNKNLKTLNNHLKKMYISDEKSMPMTIDEVSEEVENDMPLKLIVSEDSDGNLWEKAKLDHWRKLYSVAEDISDLKPWEICNEIGFFEIKKNREEDSVFITVLGSDSDAIVLAVYEGYDAFNNLFLLSDRENLNISESYAMNEQNALYLSYGSRGDIVDEQYEIIKKLGYNFRGKNKWIYFSRAKQGYFPMMLNQAEVIRLTEYLLTLREGLKKYYYEKIEFSYGNILTIREENYDLIIEEGALPFTSFQLRKLKSNDKKLKYALRTIKETDAILEADIRYVNAVVDDEDYPVAINPRICMIVSGKDGKLFDFSIAKPLDEPGIMLADLLIDYIFKNGKPKEIWVSNEIVGSIIGEICNICKIKIIYKKHLRDIDKQMQF